VWRLVVARWGQCASASLSWLSAWQVTFATPPLEDGVSIAKGPRAFGLLRGVTWVRGMALGSRALSAFDASVSPPQQCARAPQSLCATEGEAHHPLETQSVRCLECSSQILQLTAALRWALPQSTSRQSERVSDAKSAEQAC